MAETATIAIVDDDQEIREALTTLVETVGLRAEGFSSAEAFLSSPQAQDSACLLLDVRMPGMSGLELQRQLVAANWRIPIIFVTAYADDDVRVRALAAGAVDVLPKPCRAEDLLRAIQTALTQA
jgi:FixJ family two-component response regulator